MKFLSKKVKRKTLISYMMLIISLALTGCNKSDVNVEKAKDNSSSVTSKASVHSDSYASHLNLDEEVLDSLLVTKKEDATEYKLVPATSSKDHIEYYKNLVTSNPDYIQTYYLSRTPPTKEEASLKFSKNVNTMWNTKKPDYLLFLVTLNGEYCGVIECGGLKSRENPTIGYVTEKEYAGKGVATNALEMLVKLVKHLNSTGFYNVADLSLWIFDENLPSIAVAKKNGFDYAESDSENKRKRYVLKF